ncbi:SRPBCC family protein [Umezawaea endophytica]|uniref:SRPBCC family protein n=1 Tax=Umezawaea endophytica TaxID=1654476 RepID=A0A9X2VQQ0_9PSEU|nr:SRPBCC family protein [Umezawaea endophytica]MCS7481075.1 SRPBCC family protein [Umezawaea endophytica]
MSAKLETVDGRPVLRFERTVKHPVAKVWRAITEADHLAVWFPASVDLELIPGAAMRFTFPDQAPVDGSSTGEVLEVDPPEVFTFRWNNDVLRFELSSIDDGCLIRFTQVIGGGRIAAGRNAVGWDVCLDALDALLDGRGFEGPSGWLGPMEGYIREFGLDVGSLEGRLVRFVRDLVWRPAADVWALLVEGSEPAVGGEPSVRAVNGYVPAEPLTVVEAPRVLAYGAVRWEIVHDPEEGTRVELTHDLPVGADAASVLAAWHVHLELFFAATFGEIRCPWPEDRVEKLRERYSPAGE